ncbi:hypothetical protein F511_24161 [Dorcoceras hygrometricum]|uniref:F-box domain-containing protein n=1 Tax=Dorcoceras hygrometricum TaxID=472368 RepID=A0A2Z7CKA1_9LAMI|nr:hypothetical protein F511_24161 [Dorcoceras hygrometricum]
MDPRIWSRLPNHLLERILSFLPLKTFLDLRSTCKHFNSLLFTPYFISKHSLSSSSLSSFIILSHPQSTQRLSLFNTASNSWFEESISLPRILSCNLLSSSNGLLCFSIPRSSCFVLYNLLAKCSRRVSFPACLFEHESVTLVSTNNGYKLFVLPSSVGSSNQTLVYDSTVKSWRRFEGSTPVLHESCHQKGALYKGRLFFTTVEPFHVVFFHLDSGRWEGSTVGLPADLTFIRVVSDGYQKLYLVGGVGTSGISRSIKIWELGIDEGGDYWVEVETLPEMRLSLTPEVTVEPIEGTVELPKMIRTVERHAIGRYSLAPDLKLCHPDFFISILSKFPLCTMSSPSTSQVGSAAESIDSASPISQAGEPWLPEPEELPTTPWYEEKASTLRLSDIPIIKDKGGMMGKFEAPQPKQAPPPPSLSSEEALDVPPVTTAVGGPSSGKGLEQPPPFDPSKDSLIESPCPVAATRYICNMAPDRDVRVLRKARNADVVGHFSSHAAAHTEVLARLEELEILRSREKEAVEAQREALEAQMLVAKEAHEAEKAAREMLEAELEEVKSRAARDAERLKLEGKEEFLKSPEFDTLLGKKAGGFFKNDFLGCVAQWRANGYPEEEHPASFLNVQQAITEMPDEEDAQEEEEDEDEEEGAVGSEATPPSSPFLNFPFCCTSHI